MKSFNENGNENGGGKEKNRRKIHLTKFGGILLRNEWNDCVQIKLSEIIFYFLCIRLKCEL